MSLFDQLALFFISILTSMMTAAVGLGGGVALLAIMPNFMPFSAVVPVHGVVQLSSNLSRFLASFRKANLKLGLIYIPGAMLGAIVGSQFIGKVPETYLPLILGVFVLLSLWTKVLDKLGLIFNNFFYLSFIQTFFSFFVGSTGLISPPVLLKKGLNKEEVIVTHALQMSSLNTFKVIGFFLAGFFFTQYYEIIPFMIIGSVLGSLLGKKARGFIPEKQGIIILRGVVSFFSLKLIVDNLITVFG